MTNSRLMIKVGGSLCEPQLLASIARTIRVLAETYNLTIIPGGGPFANQVRDWNRRMHLSDSASHWMAMAAMDQYGLVLESLGLGTAVDNPTMLFSADNIARVFLPYRFLRDTDPLLHSWSVTSDSIAAYLASFLNVDRLVLLKSTDAIHVSPCSAKLAVESGIVDEYFERYLGANVECWIVNGREPQRLHELQNAGCSGTRVLPFHVTSSSGD